MKAIILLLLMNMFSGQNNAPVTSHKPEVVEVTEQQQEEVAVRLQTAMSGKKVMSETNQMKCIWLW
jgi:hypothetical protein